MVSADKYIRNTGYLESARRVAENCHPLVRASIQAYADGINEAVRSLPMLPIEFQIFGSDFEPWTIYDTITFVKLMSLNTIHDFLSEFVRSQFMEIYSRQDAEILGAVGPDNNFDSDMTSISHEELKYFRSTLFDDSEVRFSNITTNYQDELPLAYISQHLFTGGSNSWVIHGNHTQSG